MFKWFKARPKIDANGGDPSALIELRDVVKSFHNAAGEFTVLRGISAAFQPGEFASIVGRSGSGKSTLLNMMTGIDHPSAGYVRVGDTVLHSLDEGRLSVWRGRSMGIVFQFFQLLPMLTLLENVMLPMDFCNLYAPAQREPRALMLLEMVGLKGFEHKYPAAVSGGQQQTAAVARALATDPPILVADEPTGNLDSKTAEMVLAIFEEQARLGKTILMVTHDISLARRAQRILIISDGVLIPEVISNAFPSLSHDVLLELARASALQRYQAGEMIPTGNGAPGLVFIQHGSASAVANGLWATQVVAQRLAPGSFFSREDEQAVRRSFSNLRADTPVEALTIADVPASGELQALLGAAARERAGLFARAGRQKGERSQNGK